MLSQRSHYALRAMLILAAKGHGMQAPQIAQAANISGKFLEAVLVDLRKAGLLVSQRGRKGGYRLVRPADAISFADIVRVTDGSLALALCANEGGSYRCEDCFGGAQCEIRHALRKVREQTDTILRGYDLGAAAARMIHPAATLSE